MKKSATINMQCVIVFSLFGLLSRFSQRLPQRYKLNSVFGRDTDMSKAQPV